MTGNGTGAAANPGDGTPVLGKTGTHEAHETWMIESSTNATTAVWVGNWDGGTTTLFGKYANRIQLSDLRYRLARDVQRAADDIYGGDRFPDPASNLLRTQQRDLPNVVGQSIDAATSTLQNAGFRVTVGDPVDSPQAPTPWPRRIRVGPLLPRVRRSPEPRQRAGGDGSERRRADRSRSSGGVERGRIHQRVDRRLPGRWQCPE